MLCKPGLVLSCLGDIPGGEPVAPRGSVSSTEGHHTKGCPPPRGTEIMLTVPSETLSKISAEVPSGTLRQNLVMSYVAWIEFHGLLEEP